jgi:thiamine-phosphate pyrophosphorylase
MIVAKRHQRIRGLYAIADTDVLDPGDLLSAVQMAIAGGARIVQYRDKSDDEETRHSQALALRELCHKHEIAFIVNDDVSLAADVRADGVHLGRDDSDIAAARRRLGRDALIGVSCYNEFERALAAKQQGADYIAFGSFYESSVKPDAVRATPALLQRARDELDLPVVAIGGITPENGAELVAAGADALAVITGIFGSPDIGDAAEQYAQLFK